jgi:hypothetical protein
MAKKNWIYIKRGLSEDPKHREAMGMAVWLFMHICDAADFEKGIVYDWRDKEIAVDMSISTNTVRDWRARLVEKKYITCQQRQRGIEIVIHNWNNPRDYSGKKVNIQGDAHTAPRQENNPQGESQGDTQALHPANIESDPFIESESESISLRTDETEGRYTTKLPPNSDIGFMLAAGMSSEQMAKENEEVNKTMETANLYEACMGYNPLPWWNDRDLARLLRFLQAQTPDEIRQFAEWSKRKFSTFDPAKARMNPLKVIEFWPMSKPELQKQSVSEYPTLIP